MIKGPQATLFGTASAVGAISIVSARPKPGVSGRATVGYGNFDAYLASGDAEFRPLAQQIKALPDTAQ